MKAFEFGLFQETFIQSVLCYGACTKDNPLDLECIRGGCDMVVRLLRSQLKWVNVKTVLPHFDLFFANVALKICL